MVGIIFSCLGSVWGLVVKVTDGDVDGSEGTSWVILEEMREVVGLGLFIVIYVGGIPSA